MKLIGLLGGVTWESTKEYYRILNEEVKARLGGWHSARCLIHSVDFAEVIKIQNKVGRDQLGDYMETVALSLKAGGADFIIIGANTMHQFAERIESVTGLSVLHIADCTASAVKEMGLTKVGLTGTRFTMEEDFIKGRFTDKHGLEIIVPERDSRKAINDIIYNELARGIFRDESRRVFLDIINHLIEAGSEGVILGCTEIPLIVKQSDFSVPVFNTTELHAKAAVDRALGG